MTLLFTPYHSAGKATTFYDYYDIAEAFKNTECWSHTLYVISFVNRMGSDG